MRDTLRVAAALLAGVAAFGAKQDSIAEMEKRPIWIIYHRANSKSEIAPALSDSKKTGYRANGIEADFRWCTDKWILNHDNCGSGVAASEWLDELARVAKDDTDGRIALLWVDIKFSNGTEPISALRTMIRSKLPPSLNVMYGSATYNTRTYLDPLVYDLASNEGVSMDFEAFEHYTYLVQPAIETHWRQRGVKNVWFSDGLDPAACAFLVVECDFSAQNVRQAAWRRDNFGVFKKTASWTYASRKSALAALEPVDKTASHLGADALIVQYTVIADVVADVEKDKKMRLAKRTDNPWKHFDIWAIGDFDGDRYADRLVIGRDTGVIYEKKGDGTNGLWKYRFPEYTPNLELAMGNFDDDGRADIAMVDKAAGTINVRLSNSGTQGAPAVPWGYKIPGLTVQHVIALGDYDCDGTVDIAIVHKETGVWSVAFLSSGFSPEWFGFTPGWKIPGWEKSFEIAPGDFDGDGNTDRAAFDRKTGKWYVVLSTQHDPAEYGIPMGWQFPNWDPSWEPIFGDYDGDRVTDRAFLDRTTGKFHIVYSGGNGPGAQPFVSGWQWPGLDLSAIVPQVDAPTFSWAAMDIDGDFRTDRNIVTPFNRRWYSIRSRGTATTFINFP